MKAFKIFGITILTGILIVLAFVYFGFSGTTWGGWTPQDASLELNSNEEKWVVDFEKTNDCDFKYIGLDDSYNEDTVIYMNLYCKNNSDIGQKIIKEGEIITREYCKSFLACTNNLRPQKYIQFSYKNIKIEDRRYPVTFRYLYTKVSDYIVKIE